MAQPKYLQIEHELKAEIMRGAFQSGDRFYSESELVSRFEVSSITVIRAIKDLVNEGLLVRKQGKGTFVARDRPHRRIEFSSLEVVDQAPGHEEVQVIKFEHGRDSALREKLRLAPGEGYHRIVRVRRIEGVPFFLQVSYIPSRFIRTDVQPSYYQSIYRRFAEDFGLQLYEEASHETNEVRFPAEPGVAKLLELDNPEPYVLQKRLTTLADGSVAEYVIGCKRWNFYKIELTSPRLQGAEA